LSQHDQWDIDEDPITLYSLEELETLPGYKRWDEIDINVDPVVAVCGNYTGFWAICVMPGQHRHKTGIIGRTQLGHRVCVGPDCGAHHVPDWENKLSHLRDRTRMRDYRNTIADAIGRFPELRTRSQWLWNRPFGGVWLSSNQERMKRMPTQVRKNLEQRAKFGNVVIHEYEQLSDFEKDELKAMGTSMASSSGASTGRAVEVGRLAGLEIVRRSFKVEMSEVESRMNEIERRFDARKGNLDYRRWAKWCDEFERQLEKLDDLLVEGMRFFTRENIALISTHIATAANERMELARIRFDLYVRPVGDDASVSAQAA